MSEGSGARLLGLLGTKIIAQGLVPALKHGRAIDKERVLLAKALELVEDLPEALVELGELELQDGDIDAAAERFTKAAADSAAFHQPGESSCYIRALHGQLLTAWQRGDLLQAIQMVEHLLQRNPIDHPAVLFLIPSLQLLSLHIDNAQEFFTWYQQ